MTAVTLTPVAVKTYGPGVVRCAVGSLISSHFRSKGLEARRDKTGVNTKPFLFAPLLFLIMDTYVKLITISHANISNSKVII